MFFSSSISIEATIIFFFVNKALDERVFFLEFNNFFSYYLRAKIIIEIIEENEREREK